MKYPKITQLINLRRKNLSAVEAEIDQLVYKLYNLTPAEVDIVEGRT
jgi:hypothetical protein